MDIIENYLKVVNLFLIFAKDLPTENLFNSN